MKANTPQFRMLQAISGSFLTKRIPDDWLEMKTDDQDLFMIHHTWEPLENMDIERVWRMITEAFHAAWKVHMEVIKGIVTLAIKSEEFP